jgi:hypothetical protein
MIIPGLSSLQTQPEVQVHSEKCAGQSYTVSVALTDSCATEDRVDVSLSSSCQHGNEITVGHQQSTECNCQFYVRVTAHRNKFLYNKANQMH